MTDHALTVIVNNLNKVWKDAGNAAIQRMQMEVATNERDHLLDEVVMMTILVPNDNELSQMVDLTLNLVLVPLREGATHINNSRVVEHIAVGGQHEGKNIKLDNLVLNTDDEKLCTPRRAKINVESSYNLRKVDSDLCK
mmetsp:Transcript_11128/g.17067  ORF Transcript_11128/g.17067 Transcript_11128/m.17067 type:complete len:139 (+) Transcript_11128:3961-4377(+)